MENDESQRHTYRVQSTEEKTVKKKKKSYLLEAAKRVKTLKDAVIRETRTGLCLIRDPPTA